MPKKALRLKRYQVPEKPGWPLPGLLEFWHSIAETGAIDKTIVEALHHPRVPSETCVVMVNPLSFAAEYVA